MALALALVEEALPLWVVAPKDQPPGRLGLGWGLVRVVPSRSLSGALAAHQAPSSQQGVYEPAQHLALLAPGLRRPELGYAS